MEYPNALYERCRARGACRPIRCRRALNGVRIAAAVPNLAVICGTMTSPASRLNRLLFNLGCDGHVLISDVTTSRQGNARVDVTYTRLTCFVP